MRRVIEAAFVAALTLGLVLVSSGMFPAQAQSEDPFGEVQDQINKLSNRVDFLETQNENLRADYERLQEVQIATITMLLANYAGDCLIEGVIRSGLDIDMPTQGECFNFRLEYFDFLPIEERPGYDIVEPLESDFDFGVPDLVLPGA